MTDYRIPPVGWCVSCLVHRSEERAAVALFEGTSLCREHLIKIARKVREQMG